MSRYEEDVDHVVADTQSDVLIQASAGTGKTFNLTKRVLAIMVRDRVPIEQILVMTFTDAAAAEMQDRIFKAIVEAEHETKDADLIDFLRLQKQNFGRNSIGTIHSFAGKVIRQSGEELALMSIQATPDRYESTELLKSSASAYWNESYDLIDEYTNTLYRSGWQREFIQAHAQYTPCFRVLEKTGNSSSFFQKLETLSRLSDEHLHAAAQMSRQDLLKIGEHFARKIDDEMRAPWNRLQTFTRYYHDAFTEVFPDQPDDLFQIGWLTKTGLSKKKIVKDPKGIDREVLSERLDQYVKPLIALKTIQDLYYNLLRFVGDGEDGEDNPSALLDLRLHETMRDLADLSLRWKVFTRWKRAHAGLMNFDDLIEVAHRLIIEFPTVLERVSDRYRHVLVDEFQDTDKRQYEMIQAIATASGKRNVFLVGDMKQAIYGFRGGNVSLIRRVEDEVLDGRRQMRMATLKVSYRSEPEIIDFVNSLFSIALNPIEHERMFQASYLPLESRRDQKKADKPASSGTVRIIQYQGLKDLSTEDLQDLEKLKSYRFSLQGPQVMDAFYLASFLAGIKEDQDGSKYPEYRDIGVLMRNNQPAVGVLVRNKSNIDHLTTAFRIFGLQAVVRVGSSFFERQEVSDLYYLSRFLNDAWDDMALAAVLRSPFVGLSDAGLLAIANAVYDAGTSQAWWKMLSRNEVISAMIPPDRDVLKRSVPKLAAWRTAVRGQRLSNILEKAILDTPFLAGQNDAVMVSENCWKLIDIIRSLEDRGQAGVGEICSWLTTQLEMTDDSDALVSGEASIEITTMHRSKGLQYPMVVLSNISARGQQNSGLHISPIDTHEEHTPLVIWAPKEGVDDPFDSGTKSFFKELVQHQHRERERAEMIRLFYVAATRAKQHLVISDPSGLQTKNHKNPIKDALHDWMEHELEQHSSWLIREELDLRSYQHLMAEIIQRSKQESVWTSQTARGLKLLGSDEYQRAYWLGTAPMERPSAQKDEESMARTEVLAQWKVLNPKDAGTLIHLLLDLPTDDQQFHEQRLRFEVEGLEYDMQALGLDQDLEKIYQHAQNARNALKKRFGNFKTSYSEHPVEVYLEDEHESKSGKWLRGSIDLLAQTEQGDWVIVDFKTAVMDKDQLGSYAREMGYHQQLRLYQQAMQSLSKGQIRVADEHCLLLFTGMKEKEWVSLAEI